MPLTPPTAPPARRASPSSFPSCCLSCCRPWRSPAPAAARATRGAATARGGGGGGLIFLVFRLLFWLIFRHPLIGIPLTIALVFLFLRYQKGRAAAGPQSWDSAPVAPVAAARGFGRRQAPAARDLDALRTLDPEFSAVLFEDFVYDLFARAHTARASPRDLEALSPTSPRGPRRARAAPAGGGGGLRGGDRRPAGRRRQRSRSRGRSRGAGGRDPGDRGQSDRGGGGDRTQYVEERWRLERDASVQSKPPETARAFNAPTAARRSAPKGETAASTAARWSPAGGSTGASRRSTAAARGAPRPSPRTSRRWGPTSRRSSIRGSTRAGRSWCRPTPRSPRGALAARFDLIYGEVNAAWSRLDLKTARPYVSDSLFDYLQYWIAAYQKQGLRNVLEGMRIVEWKAVKVVRDRHYDAMTIRLWGTGRDTTVRAATGELVSGDPRRDRAYSEYWTLIRGAGVKGAPRADKSCPNCGAPLDVNQAGRCEHCGAGITSGEFDWVLSKIEQDDSYTG